MMQDDKPNFPIAAPSSSGAGGVSAPVSIMQEVVAAPQQLLKALMAQAVPSPLLKADGAAQIAGAQLLLLDVKAVEDLQGKVSEFVRRYAADNLNLWQELSGARSPADVIKIQVGYFQQQLELATSHVKMFEETMAALFQFYLR